MTANGTPVLCVRCGSPAGGAARRGAVCPGCLLAEGMERAADANWVRDRFPHLVEAVEAPGGETGTGRVFEARDFESGAAVLLSLWPLAAEGAARQMADLERRANLTHSGITRVLDFGEVDDWLYAIEARPAGQRLREAISVAEVSRGDMLRLVPEISAAVRYAAEQGVSIGAEPDTVFITGEGRVTLSGIPGATPVLRGPDSVAWVEFHPAVGRRVGRYELLELIGEGGFAEVYRAQEERPVRREVALKILKPGMDTRQILARFSRERQALALMSHGGIATIFDAGATESGRPWIAMELVAGKPLTAFCDERRMPLRERAALLATVCRAVHHGHEKGVVHRDLKPSNILVAEEDGAPVAKVIDFGIATAAAAPAGGGTFFTRTHQFLGSPCYMSPEQVNGAEVDGRSDVYSLGALLYQMLTGEPPLTEAAVKDCGLREVIECVQRQPAEHPADRVAGFSVERQEAIAAAHGPGLRQPAAAFPAAACCGGGERSEWERSSGVTATTGSAPLAAGCHPREKRQQAAAVQGGLRHREALCGELSGIALQALHKSPAGRYGSAAAMAEDLENWVRGQPVAAPLPRRRATRRALSAVRWAALLTVAVAAVALLWNPAKPVPPSPNEPPAPAWAVRHLVRSRAADGTIKPVALWQFDGDVRSGVARGPDLEAIGAPALTFESAILPGGAATVMRAARFLPSQWLKSPNVIGINGPPDATESNNWTLVFDIMFPSISGPVGLFQCDSENRAVAELYVGPGGLGDTEYGIQYGRIREGEWYRIVVVSSVSDRSQLYATWVNGARWGVPHVRGMNSAQFAFDDAMIFFGEGNQRTGEFVVNSLAVYDVPLADHEIRALGAPAAAGVPAEFHPGPAREVPGLLRAAPRLTFEGAHPGDHFGAAVAVAGDEAWIAAPGSDAAAQEAGVIHRCLRDESGAWILAGILAVEARPGERRGSSLALTPLAGVAGGNNAAWLFTRGGTAEAWIATALKCPGSNAGARFGEAAAILEFGKSRYVAAGEAARLSKVESAVAVSAPGRGAVFIYEVSGGQLNATLSPPNSAGFGRTLAAAENKLVVSDAGGKIFTFLRDAAGTWTPQPDLEMPSAALALSPDGAWLAAGTPPDEDRRTDGTVRLFAAAPDGWKLRQTIPAPDDGVAQTEFGRALLFCGPHRLLIGAPAAASEGRRTGGVHCFTWNAAEQTWQRARFLAPEDGAQEGRFGAVLAADGDSLWAGAPDDHTDHDDGGAAWPVALPHCEWQKFATETPAASVGTSVAIRADMAAAGTPGRDGRSHAGTLRVFRRDAAGLWSAATAPVLPDVPPGSFAGVTFSGDWLCTVAGKEMHAFRQKEAGAWEGHRAPTRVESYRIGAHGGWMLAPERDDGLTACRLPPEAGGTPFRIEGSFHNHSAIAVGERAALVARRDTARSVAVLALTEDSAAPWADRAVLTVPEKSRWFGRSIALHGDIALIGAPASDRSGAGSGDGGAYFFRRQGDEWIPAEALTSAAARDMPAFGSAVAVEKDTALVGNPRIADGLSHGAVEVFRRDTSGAWHHHRTLEASDAAPGDGFGSHVALNDEWAMIGAKSAHVYFFRLQP